MHEDCYFCIKRNICTKDVPKPCKYRYTEEERIADQAADRVGVILNATYLPKTYEKEDNEMKATSVQNIKNVNGVSFSIENYPMEEESKLTIVASTNDDIFEFEFEGQDLLQSCKAAGLFTGWEKDQKIKELEKELDHWKKEAAECLKLRDAARKECKERLEDKDKTIDILKSKYNLERGANEAQHKFFREYAGSGTEIEFNYAIGDGDEVTYVIVDKEEYKALKNCDCKVRLHGMDFTPDELVDRIRELEALKTPTIENFADKEPTSRRDILKAAEMCVCGQREQDYGTPESNFQLIADLWNDYLFNSSKNDITITPTDVAMFMALMKIARIRNGGGSGDSFVDLAGYAACGGEIWYGGKTSILEGE